MSDNGKFTSPCAIERRSMEIITELLGKRTFPAGQEAIVKRVIHTTADFDYADNLKFSATAVPDGMAAIKAGVKIICDTKMAAAGINQKALATWGQTVHCFIDDPEIIAQSEKSGRTRAALSMEKAARDPANRIFAIGNAPTALIKLCHLMVEQAVRPALVIGVPVGFVNVVESKELLLRTAAAFGVPYIVAEGRKGGSNVAAAIVNAILYLMAAR
jgi:precorrin-8X/cobalt-precorrin-8 methylmutase